MKSTIRTRVSWTLLVYVLSFSVSAIETFEFQSFQLSPLLKERVQLYYDSKIEEGSRSSSDLSGALKNNTARLNQALATVDAVHSRTSTSNLKSLSTRDTTFAGIGSEDGTIFGSIVNLIAGEYQQIGAGQTGTILNHNSEFDLGKQNFSGFTWQKPMGNFSIGVDRQVLPDFTKPTGWVVNDKFVLYVNASTFLHNLQEADLIQISDAAIAAFAGIEFKREYSYIHFANSYEEGLTSDYGKLFFSFLKFTPEGLLTLSPSEFIKKEDYLSAHAGAAGSVITPYYLTVNAGVLVSYNRVGIVTAQAVAGGEKESMDELIRLSMEKGDGVSVAAQAALKLEFMRLLKLTLLGIEYSYEYLNSNKIYLTLREKDRAELKNKESEVYNNIKKILRLKDPDIYALKPMIVSEEQRKQQDSNLQYRALFFGGYNKSNTEQVTIVKDGEISLFFKNYSEQIKYVKTWWTELINGVTLGLANVSLFNQFATKRLRRLVLEYKGEENFNLANEVFLHSEEELSINIRHEYTAAKLKGFFNKPYKNYAVHFVENFTTAPKEVAMKIDNLELEGPFNAFVAAQINKNGILYFNSIPAVLALDYLKYVCGWEKKSNGKYKFFQSIDALTCYDSLEGKYNNYKAIYDKKSDIALWRLKSFLSSFNRQTDSLLHLELLFGTKNVFFSGSVVAYLPTGWPFVHHFKKGTFESLGVIDDARRDAASDRAPASIPVN